MFSDQKPSTSVLWLSYKRMTHLSAQPSLPCAYRLSPQPLHRSALPCLVLWLSPVTFLCSAGMAEISQLLWIFKSSQKQMHYLKTLPPKNLDCLVVRGFCIHVRQLRQYIGLLIRCPYKKCMRQVLIFMKDRGTFKHTPINAVLNVTLIQGAHSVVVCLIRKRAHYSHIK